MNKNNLKLLSAYWSNYVSPEHEDRFRWAWEEVEEAMYEIHNTARKLLVALTKSAPDDRASAYFAAGPLETYINMVVQENNISEAVFIATNNDLRPLLPQVWGEREKLEAMTKEVPTGVKYESLDVAIDLKTLSLKDLMGFWCRVCGSASSNEYEAQYNAVLQKLLSEKEREGTISDITVSAPDDKLLTYVKDNIFVLQR